MGLKIIDGTPTAISKYLREGKRRENKMKCPKCGTEFEIEWKHEKEEETKPYANEFKKTDAEDEKMEGENEN